MVELEDYVEAKKIGEDDDRNVVNHITIVVIYVVSLLTAAEVSKRSTGGNRAN